MQPIDISVPISDGMFVYPGNPPVHLLPFKSLRGGDHSNLSRLELGVHSGTHVDAPLHFIEGGATVDALDLDVLVGEAIVVDATSVESTIDEAFVAATIPPGTSRVLFKTRNSALWAQPGFEAGYVGLSAAAARLLVERGVRLVGIDYLSIARHEESAETHLALLAAGVIIVEGLNLAAVAPGHYELVCLPLRLAGAEAAPARALLLPLTPE